MVKGDVILKQHIFVSIKTNSACHISGAAFPFYQLAGGSAGKAEFDCAGQSVAQCSGVNHMPTPCVKDHTCSSQSCGSFCAAVVLVCPMENLKGVLGDFLFLWSNDGFFR